MSSALRRLIAWTVSAAMLAPTLLACTAMPPAGETGEAGVARLDGIVVDGNRLAQPREPGLATVTRDGARQEAYAGMVLRARDRIDTGPRADAVIRYASGTEVLMRPNSGGRIGSLTDVIGEVFVKVKGLFSVDTTFVKAGARGTAYLVRTYAGGTTSVVVIDGAVEVGSTTGAWPSVTIGAGTMTLAHPRAPRPMAADVEDLARTRDWVERVERLAPPPPGVPHSGIVGAIAIGAVIAAILASGNNKGSSERGESVSPRPTTTQPPSTPPPSTYDTRQPRPPGR